MPTDDIASRLDFALEIAREAGDLTLRYFQTSGLGVDLKGDGSPVTIADRSAEDLLRRRILERFPDDGVLGEEHGETPGRSGLRWILDPIDGTASFVRGVPLFGTLVAVERDGVGIVGVVHLPAMRETVYAARGLGAWHVLGDGAPTPARVSTIATLREGAFVSTSLDYFVKAGLPEMYPRLQAAAGVCRGWSDAYAFLLLATGRAEAVVEPRVHVWDVAAVQPVIEEAGGRFSDLHGRPSLTSGACVATNGLVHEEVIAITSRHG